MPKIFISTIPETDWYMDAKFFTEQLEQKWNRIEIQQITTPESIHTLRWYLEESRQRWVNGSLTKDGKTMTFEGVEGYLIEFAIWYRSLVPENVSLTLFDEGYNSHLFLTSKTTKDQIEQSL